MIIYEQGLFGVFNLFRVHGSAAYKVFIPCLISTLLVIVMDKLDPSTDFDEQPTIEHPYGVGAFVAFFSFMLTFRLNFSYQRYWEACTAVHLMMSKWLDAAMTLAAFHYQAKSYNDLQPQAFGNRPDLSHIKIKRRSGRQALSQTKVMENIQNYVEEQEQRSGETVRGSWLVNLLETAKVIEKADKSIQIKKSHSDIAFDRLDNTMYTHNGQHMRSINSIGRNSTAAIPVPKRFQAPEQPHTTKDLRALLMMEASSRGSRKLGKHLPPTPSLFLQEAAHLVSLLNAVALSTMRNDVEIADSPLNAYLPGSPWPEIDPDRLPRDVKDRYGDGNVFWRWTYFVLSISRSERMRTLYNAVRPFGVLGGVSDQEIEILQRARGPYAKTSLCTMWLQEFITREHLHGSTGDVASPIISRLYQFISDGMAGYNQARKIVYTPFPFVHAQISSFFSLAIIGLFPALYYSYVNNLGLACVLNFFTTMCFLGMHEVARELEHPFQNVPNDLPVTTWQAQFNEALIAMYAGYNPDLFVEAAVPAGADDS